MITSRVTPIRLLLLLLLLLGVAPVATSHADPEQQAAPVVESLPDALAAIVAEAERDGGRVSFACIDLAGNWLAAHRATEAMIPASNQKLATTATAAAALGHTFEFTTQLIARGELQVTGENGQHAKLAGDLLIIGSGDPTISRRFDERDDSRGPFRRWARHLHDTLGLREISGDIVCDGTCFDTEFIHPSWPRDQLLEWYEAPVAGLSLEDNTFRLIVTPRPDGTATLGSDPPCASALRLGGSVSSVAGRGNPAVWFSAADSVASEFARELRVGGKIPAASAPYVTDVAVRDPLRWFGAVLLDTLREEGITIGGTLRIATTAQAIDDTMTPLYTERTPLARAMTVCNQRSQNCYAEHLLKRLGATISGQPGSFANGSAVVQTWLQQQGVPADEAQVTDGSGMSRDNRLSSRAIVTLLRAMTVGLDTTGQPLPIDADAGPNDEILSAAMFRQSLAEAGESGTLAKRLTDLRGKLTGKTGTLNGVDSLSGYLLLRDATGQPRPVCVSILANGVSGGHGRARGLIDELVRKLARWLPSR
ncbi:MAG: D-alanyl-D-alanine carboxypeptidase/D-alanyl-D-alanine-endopeptidase [Planctomycetota bacterium]